MSMFTKFEFIKEEAGKSKTIEEASTDKTVVVPDRRHQLMDNVDESSSCNMWHLFSYYDESCVDLTEVYSNGGARARNCSTPAPTTGAQSVNGLSAGVTSFDHSSSCPRASFGGSSDAHDASWLCVVNMADLHSQDSNTSHTSRGESNLRHFETTSSFSIKTPTTPLRIAPPQSTAVAVSKKPDAGRQLQFSAAERLRREAGNVATITSEGNTSQSASIASPSSFSDYRAQIKGDIASHQEGQMCSTVSSGGNSGATGLSISSVSSASNNVPRPILVLTSVHTTNSSVSSSNAERSSLRSFPKPAYSYSCLIAMALKNSGTGVLPVNEIYAFMTENFPYFQTAPDGWKNSVRHNLSLNKCFKKIDNPSAAHGHVRKGCLWGLNETRMSRMDEEIVKWRRKDPEGIRRSMVHPERLESIEKGNITTGAMQQAAAAAALAFNDDVLADVYTDTPEMAMLTSASGGTIESMLHDDQFDDLYGVMMGNSGRGLLMSSDCATKPKHNSLSTGITLVRSTSSANSVSSKGGLLSAGMGEMGFSTGANRPLIGIITSGGRPASSGPPRAYATIKAEI